jgi:iron complex outermembrane receptor protein
VALLAGLLLCLGPGALPAQQGEDRPAGAEAGAAPADTVEVAEVEVTVTRRDAELREVPYAVTVMDAAEVEAGERRTSLQESLQGVPGVQVFNRRNFSLGDRLVVRGVGSRAQFGVRGVKVIQDGVPLTLPDGQATLTNLDLGAAERIEVVRGSASALYGNAAGGVLRVRTGRFPDAALEARPRVLFGADGLASQEARVGGRLGGVDWSLHATHLETDGFREHASAEIWRANAVARHRFDDGGEWRAVLNVFDSPFAENPSSLAADDARTDPRRARDFIVSQGAGESSSQGQAGLTVERPLGETGRIRATLWGLARDLRNPIPTRIIGLDRRAAGLRVEADGSLPGPVPLGWTAGVDAELQDDERREWRNLGVEEPGDRARAGELLLDQEEEVRFAAPFLRVRAEPVPGLRISAAARLDAYRFRADDRLLADGDDSGSRTLEELSPTVGAAWSPEDTWTLYGNLSTSFETPTTSELSNRPGGGGGFNRDLGPQQLRSLELGARGRVPGLPLRAELALYDVEVTDALLPFQGPGEEVFFRNAGQLSRRGIEARAGWQASKSLEMSLSYAYHDFTFDRFISGGEDFAG